MRPRTVNIVVSVSGMTMPLATVTIQNFTLLFLGEIMAKEKMHVSTALDISERLKKVIEILSRENTPKEYKKAIKELWSLAKETSIDYAEKPISKKAWDNLWADVIGDFIGTFESNVVDYNKDADDFPFEWFLRGMAKGMWTIYNMIEELMVREK